MLPGRDQVRNAAAVQAMFAEGKAGEALELAEVYSGRVKYEDAINSRGGKWLTPDQLQVVLAEPEAEGFAVLKDLVREKRSDDTYIILQKTIIKYCAL